MSLLNKVTEMKLLNKVIDTKIRLGCFDRHSALEDIKLSIDNTSPYDFAEMFGVLVDDSAEEFMMQFMPTYNKEVRYCY